MVELSKHMRKGLTGVTRGLGAYDFEREAEVCKSACLNPCINMQFATFFYFLHTVILCLSLFGAVPDGCSVLTQR